MIYEIEVSQIKHEGYPCFSFYKVESYAEHEAKKIAKQKFQLDTGYKPEDTKARVINPPTATDTVKE
jgi:hypothetical protein